MRLICLLIVALTHSVAQCDVILPRVLSDGMVLQRQTEARVWGWASRGESVRVQGSWMETPVTTIADDAGRWTARVPTGDAGGPFTLTVSGNTSITLRDVYVGEVWVCSGQSNMEWTLAACQDAPAIDAARDDQLRMFTVGKQISLHPRIDCEGAWHASDPSVKASFSAVAYHFGRSLREKLGVPVGLIVTAWGGTRIETWMPAARLAEFGDYADELAFLSLATGDPSERLGMMDELATRWWQRIDDAGAAGWNLPGHDVSTWQTMELPATLGPDGLDAFDGVVYFVREVELPGAMSSHALTLRLGPIDDYDDVWFNGVLIGSTHGENQWNVPREYTVPLGAAKPGRNVIAVRMLDHSGPGGINGRAEQMELVGGAERVALDGAWRYRRGLANNQLPPRAGGLDVNANTATALYNAMIEPIAGSSVRGAIWYQGESNRNNAARYTALQEAMVGAWRARFDSKDFPFYYVQIAPFGYGGDTGQTGALREAQRHALRVPNSGMVVTTDIGNVRDIHPKNKKDVGERLALWALAHDYGHDITYSGPLVKDAALSGTRVRVNFEHAAGLTARGGEVRHVQIAGANGVFHAAQAAIEDESLFVWSEHVQQPRRVRLGWGATDELNLFNGAGLPASPFEVEVR
jgi:sialate O-acetylesterase